MHTNTHEHTQERHQKEEAIINYLRQRKVPMRLQKKIREFYDYVWNTHIIQAITI